MQPQKVDHISDCAFIGLPPPQSLSAARRPCLTCAQLPHRAQASDELAHNGRSDAKGCQPAGKQLILRCEAPVCHTKEALGPIQQCDGWVLQGAHNLTLLGLLLEGGRVGQDAGSQVEGNQASKEDADLLLQGAKTRQNKGEASSVEVQDRLSP
jgi:hypothetical protein